MLSKEVISPEYFKREVAPKILTTDNLELAKKTFEHNPDLKPKVSQILYNAYVGFLRKFYEEKKVEQKAVKRTIQFLNIYFPEILSYVNDFELLKTFIYPPVKPYPLDPNIRFSLLISPKELDQKMIKGILNEFFEIPYEFDFYGVCIFKEKDLEQTSFIEDWRKEQILNEAKYITQQIFFVGDDGEFKPPALIFRYKGEYWYIVKYYFPRNIYLPYFQTEHEIGKRWSEYFENKWLGFFLPDIYGKKPSAINLLRDKDTEFFTALRKGIRFLMGD